MRASKRYEIVSTWETVGNYVVTPYYDGGGLEVRVTREVANIRDTVGGHVYTEGAYRVKAVRADGSSYSRSKTFYGEVAWSDSRRLYSDIISEVEHFREGR